MDQYKKLLNAVNTTKKDPIKSLDSSVDSKQKVSFKKDLNDEQQPTEVNYIPSTSVKQPQQEKPKIKKKIPDTRPNDYDSGIGITNLTKVSYDR